MGEIRDVQLVSRPADQKEVGDWRSEDCFLKGFKFLIKKIRKAYIRVGNTKDRMKIGCTEIGIDKKGLKPLSC
jgi:hypothetical protein